MRKILKYKFSPLSTIARHMIPEVFVVRHVGIDPADGNSIAFWAQVDIDSEVVEVTVQLFGTGEEIPKGAQYCGSVIMSGYVFHMCVMTE